jgi:hypothetical protein
MNYTGRTLRDEDVRQSNGDNTINPIIPSIHNNAIASPPILISFLFCSQYHFAIIPFNLTKIYPSYNKLNVVNHFHIMQQHMQSYSTVTTSNNEPTTKHFQDHGG